MFKCGLVSWDKRPKVGSFFHHSGGLFDSSYLLFIVHGFCFLSVGIAVFLDAIEVTNACKTGGSP